METLSRMRRREFNSRLMVSLTICLAGSVLFFPYAADDGSPGLLTILSRLLLLASFIVSFLVFYPACVKRVHDLGLSSLVLLPFATLGAVSIFAASRGVLGIFILTAVVCLGFLTVLMCSPSGPDNAYGACPVERRSPLRPRTKARFTFRIWAAQQRDRFHDVIAAVLIEYNLKAKRINGSKSKSSSFQ